MKEAIRYFILASLISLLAACASSAVKESPDNKIAENFQAPDRSKKVLMLPPRADYHEFSIGESVVKQNIYEQLKRAGYQAVMLDENNYKEIWGQEVAAVGGVYDPQTGGFRRAAYMHALSEVVKRVAAETDCSIVLVPRLVVRTATVSFRSGTWDGVKRRQRQEDYSPYATYSGTTAGLSMELMGFNPQGEWQFTTYGGIMLPYEINGGTRRQELRHDLFSAPQEIEEAVGLALRPVVR